MSRQLVPIEIIEKKIFIIRGKKVMFDKHLADLYNIGTRYLNKAVKRNLLRFPKDFMFQLNKKEYKDLMFQIGTSSWGGTRKLPYVFTEQGIAMLSSVLNSKRAILVNIQIMRIFTKLRKMLSSHKELRRKIEELEKKYDTQFKVVFDVIKQLFDAPKDKNKKKIGFIK